MDREPLKAGCVPITVATANEEGNRPDEEAVLKTVALQRFRVRVPGLPLRNLLHRSLQSADPLWTANRFPLSFLRA